jgi:hypothetical protein
LHEADYAKIRAAWDAFKEGVAPAKPKLAEAEVRILDKAPPGRPFAPGTHSCIFGHINSIPKDVLAAFDEVRRVDGVQSIQLGQFSNSHNAPAKPYLQVQASKLPGIIDGKLHAKGPKGTIQQFQVKVADPSRRDAVLRAMIPHLNSRGCLRGVNFSRD